MSNTVRVLVALATLGATGCAATGGGGWVHPTKGLYEFHSDEAAYKNEEVRVRAQVEAARASNPGASTIDFAGIRAMREVFGNCMKARGWRLEKAQN